MSLIQGIRALFRFYKALLLTYKVFLLFFFVHSIKKILLYYTTSPRPRPEVDKGHKVIKVIKVMLSEITNAHP